MSKRRQFVIATLVITISYFLVNLVPFFWRYQAIFGLALFVFFYLYLLFSQLTKNRQKIIVATFLPVSFVTGISLFHFLFSQGWLWQALLLSVFFLGVYTLLLVENVFLVSSEFKTVPLYRAASTVGLLLMLTSAFLLFNVILSFRLPSWANGLAVFGVTALLLNHFFWSLTLSLPFEKDNLSLVLVLSFVISEISIALSFWPVGVNKGSLYIVSLFYVFGGLAQAQVRQRLFKKTIWEFIWIGLGTFLALFLVTNWGGDF